MLYCGASLDYQVRWNIQNFQYVIDAVQYPRVQMVLEPVSTATG